MTEEKEWQLERKIISLYDEIYELKDEIKNLKRNIASNEDWLQEVHIDFNEHKDDTVAHDYDGLNSAIESDLEEQVDDLKYDVINNNRERIAFEEATEKKVWKIEHNIEKLFEQLDQVEKG